MAGKKRLRAQDVIDIYNQTALIYAEVGARLEEALERASRDSHGGVGSSDLDSRGSRNDDGTKRSPTVALALSGSLRDDPVPAALRELVAGLLAMRQTARFIAGKVAYLAAIDEKAAAQFAGKRGWTGAHCVNCSRWVPNTREDRLKAGRCDTCYQYRRRHAGKDRQVPGNLAVLREDAGNPRDNHPSNA